MYNMEEDVIVISSSDEETTFIPNKRTLNTLLVVPGQSSSRCPVAYWRPEDLGYNMQLSFEDTDVTGKGLAITSELNLQRNMNKVIIAKKNLDNVQDQQNDWSIASSSVLKRAHHADPGENNAVAENVPLDLRKKSVDKQKQIKIEDTDNSQDVEDTQSINKTEETGENSNSQPIDVVGIENSSYSENKSTFDCRVGHGWYSIQNSSENKEIDETILLTSSDDEVNIM